MSRYGKALHTLNAIAVSELGTAKRQRRVRKPSAFGKYRRYQREHNCTVGEAVAAVRKLEAK